MVVLPDDGVVGIMPRGGIWSNPFWRGLFFQALLLGIVLVGGFFLFSNMMDNLEQRKIASGFGFLKTTAGFSIVTHLVEYSAQDTFGRAFLVALLNTIVVACAGIFFATVLGFLVGVARLSSNWLVSRLATVYVEALRNVPLLLQIFFWYFVTTLGPLPDVGQSFTFLDAFFLNKRGLYLPAPVFAQGFGIVFVVFLFAVASVFALNIWARLRQERAGLQFPVLKVSLCLLFGLPFLAVIVSPLSWEYPELGRFDFKGGMKITSEFITLVIALSMYTSAFIAEIVRSGILSVDKGQLEAAYALGMRPRLALRLVVIRQAMRVIIPLLTSQYLNLTKNSSLATAIAYPDLVAVFVNTAAAQTGQAVEIIFLTMSVYLTLSLLISVFMNWYNKKTAIMGMR